MDLENILLVMDLCMKDNGKMILKVEPDLTHIKMAITIKVLFSEGLSMDKEFLILKFFYKKYYLKN